MSKGGRRYAGFTIFETMIVLAVTGGLFVLIVVTLAGRQASAEFTHSIQSIQSQMQQVIDQTANGFFPNTDNFSCTGAGGSVQITAGGNTQGTNQTCVFLGRVIQFGVKNTSPEQYQVYTIAGLRSALAGSPSPFQNADPTVVGVNYAASDAGLTPFSTSESLQYGLTTLWMKAGGANIGAVGFLMEPGSLSSSSGLYQSGAQQVDLVPIPTTSLGQTLHDVANAINANLDSPSLSVNPSGGVQICFVSGGTNQSGLITIGGSGRQLVVKLDIKSDRDCS